MKNRVVAAVLAALTLFCIVAAAISPVFATEEIILISNAEEFNDFSKKCTLDAWSLGKTVNLSCNIDFAEESFIPIATFCGVFDGKGYTISGITFENKGSYQGLFRYIQEGGEIKNLNVSGSFIPSGSKSFVGGIAGENSGNIENCSFYGSVKGENVIGGIVGNNTDSGKIISCTSSGNAEGENSTGGICGKNSGFIQKCINNSSVNTVYEEKKNDISDIDTDTGAIIENYKNSEEENKEESAFGHTDTGGIAGYSSGIIQGCINNADVGYKHIGYNVGGIAGRQAGYMLGCKNYGNVMGRKDVGGIIGQQEPYILLNASEATLKDLRSELNKLNSTINKFIADSDNLGDITKIRLDGISDYAKDARNSAESLLNIGADFVDDNLDEINAQAAILSNTLDKLSPVFESLENGSGDLSDALEKISNTLDNTNISAPDLKDEINYIASAASKISRAEKSIEKAVERMEKAEKAFNKAFDLNNEKQVKSAVSDMYSAINDIINAKKEIEKATDEIEKIISEKPESFEKLGINAKEVADALKSIGENVATEIKAYETISKSLNTIIVNTEINFPQLKLAVSNTQMAFKQLSTAMEYITEGIERLASGLTKFSDAFSDYADDLTDELDKLSDGLSEGIRELSYASDDLKKSIVDMKNIIEDLADDEPLAFVKLGDDFKNSSEKLFDSLSGISNELNGLKEEISTEKEKISDDLSLISSQFNSVMNLLIDELESISEGSRSLSDIFLDASDENIENTKQGKTEDCKNFGSVSADRNTGGIAGAMAIEYSKDPEDDIEKPNTFNFTYRTKAILQSCVNEGEITGKKDCTGGIVGHQEIGTVYECENYGDAESKSGNYVGGITGKSEASIRKSYAKSRLTGKRYVGGIAGKGDTVISCCAIVNVSGDESLGAICGSAQSNDNLLYNYFTDNGLGAVDGISYSGKCEPVDFEMLKTISGVPSKFISFTVTFTADDEIVSTQDIEYMESTERIKYPDIPKKDGYFGNWQAPKAEYVTENITIECEYQPYITLLSSEEKNESGKLALALCEGEFTDKAKLHILKSDVNSPKNIVGNTVCYNISLLNSKVSEDDDTTFRILNEDKQKVTAWILKNGKWEKIKTSSKGKYVVLKAKGGENTVCLKYEKRSLSILAIILFLIIIALAVALLLIKKKKIKLPKKKKAEIQN